MGVDALSFTDETVIDVPTSVRKTTTTLSAGIELSDTAQLVVDEQVVTAAAEVVGGTGEAEEGETDAGAEAPGSEGAATRAEVAGAEVEEDGLTAGDAGGLDAGAAKLTLSGEVAAPDAEPKLTVTDPSDPEEETRLSRELDAEEVEIAADEAGELVPVDSSTPVLTRVSRLVSPAAPAAPGIAIGTLVTPTTGPGVANAGLVSGAVSTAEAKESPMTATRVRTMVHHIRARERLMGLGGTGAEP